MINNLSKRKKPLESGYKFPGATMGVNNEKKGYGQILKKKCRMVIYRFIKKIS